MSQDLPPNSQVEKSNFGNFKDVDGNIQFGDNNTYISNDVQPLYMAIQEVRRRSDLPQDACNSLDGFLQQLQQPDAASQRNRVLTEFHKLKAQLDHLQVETNKRLKIWLNRNDQRTKLKQCLKSFYQQKETISPLVFCIAGDADQDGLEEATEMLWLHYSKDLMRLKAGFVHAYRMRDSVSLTDAAMATDAFEDMLRDILDMGLFDERSELLQKLNAPEFQNKHFVLRCRVRHSTKEGLSAFFSGCTQAFERTKNSPFLLLLEFDTTPFEDIQTLLGENFAGCSIALLPLLGKVKTQDVTQFFDRPLELPGYRKYDDLFDRNSLTTADTPLRFRAAFNKLQLKIR